MDFTNVSIKIANPQKPQLSADTELLVDSGALYSIVPAQFLRNIALEPKRRQTLILANGDSIARPVGEAIFRFSDYEGTAPVIFGEETDKAVLAVVTLEVLGLQIDPIRQELKPAPGLLLALGKTNASVSRYG